MSDEIHYLNPRQMDAFLERRRAVIAFASEMSLAENLAEILRKANEFVPSSAGWSPSRSRSGRRSAACWS